jgi:hypothetical protein
MTAPATPQGSPQAATAASEPVQDQVIVEERVVSQPGARVTATVFVLSAAAALALQTTARIPPF